MAQIAYQHDFPINVDTSGQNWVFMVVFAIAMSYNKTKTDPVLGQQVHEHLVSVGVETPVTDNGLSSTEKIDKISPN